jgi:hypothetical protein
MEPLTLEQNRNLDLQPEQVVILLALRAVNSAINAFSSDLGSSLRTSLSPLLSDAINATLSATKCPFAAPPADIVDSFDPTTKNRIVKCLHPSPHCWTWSGQYRNCP